MHKTIYLVTVLVDDEDELVGLKDELDGFRSLTSGSLVGTASTGRTGGTSPAGSFGSGLLPGPLESSFSDSDE